MDGHSFIFLGGMHRSGTSLVHRLLRDHEQVSGFRDTDAPEDEGQHLQRVFPTGRDCGGPGRFGWGAGGHLTEVDAARLPEPQQLFEQWALHWDLTRPVLIEKSPPNIVRTRFLQALFPRSRFLIVVRHPLFSCMATKKWAGRQSLESLLDHWFHCHQVLQQDAPGLRSLRVVKYEWLCADPVKSLAELADFAGLDGALDSTKVHDRASDVYVREWRAMLESRAGRRSARQLIDRFEGSMDAFGYSFDDLSRSNPLNITYADPEVL